MECFEKESLLLKGFYGSTKGALSFKVWVDLGLMHHSHPCDLLCL
jgi:hypothetical protein